MAVPPSREQISNPLTQLTSSETLALVYESEDDQLATLLPFIQIGIQHRERTLCLTGTPAPGLLSTAAGELGTDPEINDLPEPVLVEDIEHVFQDASVLSTSAAKRFLNQSWANAQSAGFLSLRIALEVSALGRRFTDSTELIQFENHLATAVQSFGGHILYMYNRQRLPAAMLRDALLTHTLVVSQGLVCRNPFRIPTDEILGPNRTEHEVDRLLGGIRERDQFERQVRKTQEELEKGVEATAVELARANRQLQAEITDRKRAEQALRFERDFAEGLIDTALAMVLVLDNEGRIVRFNPYLEEISGYRLEEVQGKDWFTTFLPESIRDHVRDYFQREIRKTRTQGNVDAIVTKDGRHRDIEWNATILSDSEGRKIGHLVVGQDITDRIRAERALRESEANLRAIFNSVSHSIILVDAEGKVRVCNRLAETRTRNIFGRAIAVGDSIHDFIPDEDKNAFSANFEDALMSTSVVVEEKVTRPDGEIEWFEVCYEPVTDTEGEPWGVCMSALSISERKRAEKALLGNLQFMATLLDAIPSPVFYKNLEGVYQGCNRVFAEDTIGLSKERIIGKTMEELGDAIPPEMASMYRQQDLQLLREGGIQRYEAPVRLPDGQIRQFQFNKATYTDSAGRLAGILGVMVDITVHKQAEDALQQARAELEERIQEQSSQVDRLNETLQQQIDERHLAEEARGQSEAKFAKMFMASPDLVLITRLEDSKILDANDSFLQTLGYSRDEVVGQVASSLGHWTEPEHRVSFVRQLVANQNCDAFESHFRTKQGRDVTGLISGRVIDWNGEQCVLSIIRDITDRRALEAQLAQQRDRIEDLQTQHAQAPSVHRRPPSEDAPEQEPLSFANLAPGIAHEINNPVGIILLAAQLAIKALHTATPDSPATVEQCLRRIETNAQRCSEIVRNAMALLEPAPDAGPGCDLNEIVESILPGLQREARIRGLRLAFDPTAERLPVNAPEPLLRQVLTYLTLDALDRCAAADAGEETPTARGPLTLTTARVADEAEVSLCDHQPACPAPRDSLAPPRSATGNTLSLAVSQAVIAHHGGTLTCAPTPDHGTCTTLKLPRHPPQGGA